MDLHKIDKRLSEIAGKIDLYSFLTPTNQEEEKKKFFNELSAGGEYNPVFAYKVHAAEDFRKELVQLKTILAGGHDVIRLLHDKTEQIISEVDLLAADDVSFAKRAIKLHGSPGKLAMDKAFEVLEKSLEEDDVFPEETISPQDMADTIKKTLSAKGVEWGVKVSSKIVPKITVSGRDRMIYINSRINYTPQEMERLKVHEVEVHIYRGANGHLQPYRIFSEGTSGYNATEEGLAIVAEELTGCLKTDIRQMKLYAGRAVAASLALEKPFFEVFKDLRAYFPEDIAYRLAERVKRGMRDTSKPGGLTKGYHYVKGWIDVKNFIDAGGDPAVLYAGKIGIGDVDIVKKMLDEKELKLPQYVPEFLVKGQGVRGKG